MFTKAPSQQGTGVAVHAAGCVQVDGLDLGFLHQPPRRVRAGPGTVSTAVWLNRHFIHSIFA